MGVFKKSLPLFFFLLFGLMIAVYLLLPGLAGQIVVKVFEKGTGCDVKVLNPEIKFIKLQASIDHVRIRCEEDGDDGIFYAKKVRVGISWNDLFEKRIKLSPLEIEGAKVVSRSNKSAFIRTLQFILKKPETKDTEPGWIKDLFSPIITGWKVWVPKVLVRGQKNKDGSLIFGYNDFSFRIFDPVFTAVKSFDHQDAVVVLNASAKSVQLESPHVSPRPLGELKFNSEVNDGILEITEATLIRETTSEDKKINSSISVLGSIIAKEDRLDLESRIQVSDSGLNETLAPEFDNFHSGEVLAKINVNGHFKDLSVSGEINGKSLTFKKDSKYYEIGPKNFSIKADFNTSKKELQLRKINIDSYFEKGKLDISLSEVGSIPFDLETILVDKNKTLSGELTANGTLDVDSKYVDIQSLSLTSLSLSEVLRKLNKATNFNLFLLLPEIVKEYPYFISVNGSTKLNLETLLPESSEISAVVKADGIDKYLSLTLDSLAEQNTIYGYLIGVQKEPVLRIGLGPDRFDGEYLLEDIPLRNIPLFNGVFRKGFHYLSIAGALSGSIDNPKTEGGIQLISQKRKRNEDSQLESQISYSLGQEKFSVQGSLFNDSLMLDCNARKQSNANDSLYHKCSVEFLNTPIWFLETPGSDELDNVTLLGDINYEGYLSSFLDGTGFISIEEIKIPEESTLPRITTKIEGTLKKGTFELVPIEIFSKDNQLVLSARVNKTDGWDINVRGGYYLGDLVVQTRVLEGLSGLLDIDLSLKGDFESPELDGYLDLSDGAFSFSLGDGIVGGESFDGRFDFNSQSIKIENLEGEFEGGEIVFKGELNSIFSPKNREGGIMLDAREVRLEPISGLSFSTDADISFTMEPEENPLLKGEILLDDAAYENIINFDTVLNTLKSFVLSGFSVKGNRTDPLPDSNINIDLSINAPAGLYLDTSVLEADFIGGVNLTGSLFAPNVNGEVKVVDGRYSISQTEFRIISGRAVFDGKQGKINPSLSLSSEGELRSTTGEIQRIYLTLGGTLRSPRVNLNSDGYASQRELAQSLGMGGAAGAQLQLVDKKRSKRAGFREVLSPTSDLSLTDRFVGLTGIDDLRLENTISIRTGEFVPQVAGSRPLPFDLRGVLSSELAGDRTHSARLEYELSERFTPFIGWRSQSVLNPNTTSAANFLFGIRFEETFKGFSLFQSRVKEK